jgi:hypothetical protein
MDTSFLSLHGFFNILMLQILTAANSDPQQKLLPSSFWCHMDGPCESMWTWMLVMIVIFYYDQWRDAFIWRTDQSSVEQWS